MSNAISRAGHFKINHMRHRLLGPLRPSLCVCSFLKQIHILDVYKNVGNDITLACAVRTQCCCCRKTRKTVHFPSRNAACFLSHGNLLVTATVRIDPLCIFSKQFVVSAPAKGPAIITDRFVSRNGRGYSQHISPSYKTP